MCLWMFYESNWAEESSCFDRQSLFRGIKIQQKVIDFWGIYALWKINQTFLQDRYDYLAVSELQPRVWLKNISIAEGTSSFRGLFKTTERGFPCWFSPFSPSIACFLVPLATMHAIKQRPIFWAFRWDWRLYTKWLIVMEFPPESFSRIHRM